MMRTCPDCGRYTFQDRCPACDSTTRDPAPAKFSPDDTYGKYRRKLKRLDEAETSDD